MAIFALQPNLNATNIEDGSQRNRGRGRDLIRKSTQVQNVREIHGGVARRMFRGDGWNLTPPRKCAGWGPESFTPDIFTPASKCAGWNPEFSVIAEAVAS
jgi:hypothetical protein